MIHADVNGPLKILGVILNNLSLSLVPETELFVSSYKRNNIAAQILKKHFRDLTLVPMKLKSIENSQLSQPFIVKIISLNFVTNVDSFSSCNVHTVVITITIKIHGEGHLSGFCKFFR